MKDFPGILLVATIWAYWLGVGVMLARVQRETRTLAGLIPEQRQERWLWLLWVPLVAAWIVLPYLALVHPRAPWAAPVFGRSDSGYLTLRWVAASCGVLSLLLTSVCWGRMGRHWRLDVSTASKGELIIDGPFGYVRHPIYALSRLLIACSVVVVPTWPMLALAVAHFGLTQRKAYLEERHLLSVHGAAYRDYAARTGRFLPMPRPARRRPSGGLGRAQPGEEP